MTLYRLSAFSDGARGGNPAGVHIGDTLPDDAGMQRIAADLGFSETAFAAPITGGWRVRYFAPMGEVPFCGHATLALRSRADLARMAYDFETGRRLMLEHGLVTIALVHAGGVRHFDVRNAFASGGVAEDPATGAAAAAFAGYLRDLGWPHGGAVEILQGHDMGAPSRLHVGIGPGSGESVRVSGATFRIDAA